MATPGLVISAYDLATIVMTSNNIHSTGETAKIENGTICVGKFILQNRKRLAAYLILDCKNQGNGRHSSGGTINSASTDEYGQIYIAGTLPLNADIIDCICKTAKSRLKSAKEYLDIDYGFMTPSAQATLEFLLSMRRKDVSLIIIGDSPGSTTSTNYSQSVDVDNSNAQQDSSTTKSDDGDDGSNGFNRQLTDCTFTPVKVSVSGSGESSSDSSR